MYIFTKHKLLVISTMLSDFNVLILVQKITDAEQDELAKHKEMVREMFSQTPDDSTRKLELIDEIQRLGVEYHFTKEIEESLKYIHDNYMHQNCKDDDDLRVVALRFRLLRQQGYNVPCGKIFIQWLLICYYDY